MGMYNTISALLVLFTEEFKEALKVGKALGHLHINVTGKVRFITLVWFTIIAVVVPRMVHTNTDVIPWVGVVLLEVMHFL